MTSFEELGLRAELLRALQDMGFTTPTPVQEAAIPLLLTTEKDVIALAQTGTGKTAAFGLPLLEDIEPHTKMTQALVLAPTRELCMQITGDLERFAQHIGGVRIVAVYGGASVRDQIRSIQRGAHIIVATPGRLLDLMGRQEVDLSQVDTVILDEADEMLNMGFQEDLAEILGTTPKDKNTWLFSATMSPGVRRIAKGHMRDTEELNVGQANRAADAISHQYCVVSARDRYAALKRFMDSEPDMFAIVFCRTKHETQTIAGQLVKDGYVADALHGDLSQSQRDHVMGRYRARSLQLLIATDVAARGIDVNDVTHVIHYDLPNDPESYTHRSGRTARAGRSGVSLAIIGVRDINKVRQLERMLKTHFTYVRVPGGGEIGKAQLMAYLERLKNVEVDHEALASLLPTALEDLSAFTKEQLIERFMSLAFNRILEQYRTAFDLNVDMSRKDHTAKVDRPSSRERFGSGRQMFINLGTADGFDKGKMLGYICGVSGISGEHIGRMTIKDVYSFVDIEPDHFDQVFNSFKSANYKGRNVRVDESQGDRGTPRPSGGNRGSYPRPAPRTGGYSGGDRSAPREHRGPRSDGDRPAPREGQGFKEGRKSGGYKGGSPSSRPGDDRGRPRSSAPKKDYYEPAPRPKKEKKKKKK